MARTQQQIIEDCQKAYDDIKAQVKSPDIQLACKDCRWYSMEGHDGFKWDETWAQYHTCRQPLVKGLKKGITLGRNHNAYPFPCGPEKALWEKPLTLKDKIVNFLTR